MAHIEPHFNLFQPSCRSWSCVKTGTLEKMMRTQNEQILSLMKKGISITPVLALNKFGCFRLAARIHDLRSAGNSIRTDMVEHGDKRYACYSLIGQGTG
jgi:hypothetical protein